MDHNASSRRSHYHRGRRGTDRRGSERRTSPQTAEQSSRNTGDQVDVDQIMREIRSRVSQRHGIDLTPQQIQELAARRLEAILDPRNVNPTLFDQLRKGAAAAPDPVPQPVEDEREITEEALYEGSGAVRFFRRLLNPLLKLLFNPAPLIAALQAQARRFQQAATRAGEHERRQTEWNALHYQVLQRLVTEVSRNSLEVQALSARVESLAARVDFNDRRMRTLESPPAPSRNQRTHDVPHQPAPVAAEQVTAESLTGTAAASATPGGQPDGQRRRRRRRRGRRGSTPGVEGGVSAAAPTLATPGVPDEGSDEEYDEEAVAVGFSESAVSADLTPPEPTPAPLLPSPGPAPEVVPEPAPPEPVDSTGTRTSESQEPQ